MTHTGIPDAWLAANFSSAQGFDPYGDPDGDGINNAQENLLGLDPNSPDATGLINPGFDDAPTAEADLSFRKATFPYPSDLYPQDGIPGWQADAGGHIELWDEGYGNTYVELQSHFAAHGVKQEFDMLPGSKYTFILRYKGRYDDFTYDNAFDLKVEGASELLVDGSPATAQGSTRIHSFMDDDEWDKYQDWHYATVSITAESGGTGLKPLTLKLVPKTTTTYGANGQEEITYGGFVDLIPVDIDDNEIATGVDDVSITANTQDIGHQDKFWIMAPSGNDPNNNPCSNAMKFKIPFSSTTELEIFYPQGKQAPATASPSTVTLGAAGVDCSWHGESATTTETPATEWKIGASGETKTEVKLPIAVKTMKRRTVKVAVFPVRCKPGNRNVPMPDEGVLENWLNQVFAYQVNAWFDVEYKPQTDYDYDPDNDGIAPFWTKMIPMSQEAIYQAGNNDIRLFVIDWVSLRELGPNDEDLNGIAQESPPFAVINAGLPGVPARPAPQVIETIAHELGHVLCGEGHPDQGGGRAPLTGTDHSKRLMSTIITRAAGAKLLVKKEWDEAEEWLKARPNDN